MSSLQARSRPQPEISPPASPSDRQPHPIAGSKKTAAKRLPASPPASASPSPAHVSAPLSPHVVPAATISMPPSVSSTVTASRVDARLLPTPSATAAPTPLSRTSSKHRLDDQDVADEPNKRRRTDHDREDASIPDHVIRVEQPIVQVESLFCLSTQVMPRSHPHPTQDLFSLYNLDSLANSVRRKDPVTGDKINKLRKSYENKIKVFAGKNKPVTKEGEFFHLLNYPDAEWDAQQFRGKELASSLSTNAQDFSEDMAKSVDNAMAGMASGPLPDNERNRWRSFLELEPAVPKVKTQDINQGALRGQVRGYGAQIPAEEPPRPRRRGTKRNYNDDAFEGYNEGYADDDHEEVSEDGDDDRRSSISAGQRKRRRKELGSSSYLAGSPQWASSPVGVGVPQR